MITQGNCADKSPCGEILKHLEHLDISDDIVFIKTYPMSKEDVSNLKIDKDKKGFAIWIDDYQYAFNLDDNITLFRTSLNRTNRGNNEYAFPWCFPMQKEHFAPLFNELSIGFCGLYSNKERREVIDWFKNSNLKTNFILRGRFIRQYDAEEQKQYRYDFLECMKENLFSLCPRGAGNFSLRFYETMRYGRIPVLLNRNMVLPFEDIIDWEDTIIMSDSPEELEHKVLSWYNKGKDFLIDRQENCKYIYDKYLSVKGFANNLLRYVI